MARVVTLGFPHHVTHPGNHREPVFFMKADRSAFPGSWLGRLVNGLRDKETEDLRPHTWTGRPLGEESFVKHLEGVVGRLLRTAKPGPKRRGGGD
jgi:hypothetical protein